MKKKNIQYLLNRTNKNAFCKLIAYQEFFISINL